MSRMSALLISTDSSLPPNVHGKIRGYLEIEVTRINFTTSHPPPLNTRIDRFIAKNKRLQLCAASTITKATPIDSQVASAKLIWWGECNSTASSIRILQAAKGAVAPNSDRKHFGYTNNNNNNVEEEEEQQESNTSCLQRLQLKCSKVRYSIQTSSRLFLEYLQSCEPLEISVSTNVSNLPLGRAQVRLPKVFVRKFATNYGTASNFEHKSKIYALYAAQSGRTSKCGEFQLRFRIMFAPSAKQMLQEQLHSTLGKELQLKSKSLKLHEEHSPANNKFASATSSRKSSKTDEIVEAMMKIDAKLVAYLAGEEVKPKEKTLVLERLQCRSPISKLVGEMVQERFRQQQLKIYQRVNTLKMHLEALTLQPAGTKYMQLLEEDIKPIFTVECQLPNELISHVTRYDMFHVMQFESGHFQSLTQCTRFAQDEQREIHLLPKQATRKGAEDTEMQLDFGKLNFIIWWRQPGTCLNEMLGLAEFDLEELYQASLLEQCKCLAIKRRDVHLGNLYFKISFQLRRNSNGELQMLNKLREQFLATESSGDSIFDADEIDDGEQANKKQQPADVKEAKNMENTAARGGDKPSDKVADMKKASNNNNPQLDSAEFAAETTRVRLLKGYLYANEARNLPDSKTLEYFLLCRRFWHRDAAAIAMQASPVTPTKTSDGHFKYQEQFAVLNDELFLHRVEKQFLQLELWRRSGAGNGNSMQPYGLVRLPLHQYYIAYRDAAITNHLCNGKLPVISVDAWAPIISFESGEAAGELKCLLAIGSEAQIEHLRTSRGLMGTCDSPSIGKSAAKLASLFSTEPLEHPAAVAEHLKLKVQQIMAGGSPAKAAADAANANIKRKHTTDLLDMLQNALIAPSSGPAAATVARVPVACPVAHAASALQRPQSSKKCFDFFLNINGATNIPLNPSIKGGKKGAKRNSHVAISTSAKQSRYPPNEPPSVYVTFQAEDHPQSKQYKSHEGLVYATNIAERSIRPVWQQRFRVTVSIDYLSNPQKSFILKVWKKAATDLAQCRLQPTPLEDAIIGFAAIDLSVFLHGQQIAGWFNIVDFNGRINGQLELQCEAVEDVQALLQSMSPFFESDTQVDCMETFIDQFDTSLELSHLNIGQAIKRKYTELEQISLRLRSRLADVTGQELAPSCDRSRLDGEFTAPLPSTDNAECAELAEFEQDLNTPPQEEEEEDMHLPHGPNQ